ncbi:hypothetical protein FM114_10440 [Luteococcus japonicus LSP_Lj1]|uniref:Uncharacterized protein n=1 Tax=Luteococcus japonicus LSP_Lj1 TaxID=1255658 RepID=A0A1R4JZ47_9ACTN|nr:hypothetical protein FM114_10440 [Luteococcus japonicus LSP_Lj1]
MVRRRGDAACHGLSVELGQGLTRRQLRRVCPCAVRPRCAMFRELERNPLGGTSGGGDGSGGVLTSRTRVWVQVVRSNSSAYRCGPQFRRGPREGV